uniref:Dolichol-phosphate mannosyltransferase subunit 1 n=1 Tax=Lygus hesperus TaxID=30085 RepID=A0A0A9YZT2_LYGHE
MYVRRKERGLSSAVIYGFQKAKYEILLVMDADLQHNPIYIPDLIRPILDKRAEFVIGSRFVEGGAIVDWAVHRQLISKCATLLAAPLASVSDPMSGFFCLTRTVLQRGLSRLNPVGYKIGLELLVRCRCYPVVEVPIVFQDRVMGESKLTLKQNLLYLQHILTLYRDYRPMIFLGFVACVVGAG